jgi:prepilin-type N-terminal cleavage/methylation domain-containing protein
MARLAYTHIKGSHQVNMQRRTHTSSHVLERGFTVVELLTTIIVLGILVGIAIGSATGYQQTARNREREADISLISQSIERYYRTNAVGVGATYPSTSVDLAFLNKTIIEDQQATVAPLQENSSVVIANTAGPQNPTISQYIYQPLTVEESLCTAVPCAKYKLYYKLENKAEVSVRNSLRQQ